MSHQLQRHSSFAPKYIYDLIKKRVDFIRYIWTAFFEKNMPPLIVSKAKILTWQNWAMDPSLEIFLEKGRILQSEIPCLRIIQKFL